MRRKQLSIIFFSVLMIAATPRVITKFSSYTDALHQKAESEWLHLLLGFANADESDKNSVTPKPVQETSACPLQIENAAQPQTAKSSSDAKKSSRLSRLRDRTFAFAVATLPSTHAEEDGVAEVAPLDRAARRHISRTTSRRDDPLAIDRDMRTKAEYLKILIRTLRLSDSKAVRALKREVAAVSNPKTWSFATAPASSDKSTVQMLEAECDVVDCESNIDTDASAISTLDAQ